MAWESAQRHLGAVKAHVMHDVMNQARITCLAASQATVQVLHCASNKSNRILRFHTPEHVNVDNMSLLSASRAI